VNVCCVIDVVHSVVDCTCPVILFPTVLLQQPLEFWSRVGPGQSPLIPSLPHLLLSLVSYFPLFPFLTRFIYFLAFPPFPFYQNSCTPLPGQMSNEATKSGFSFFLCVDFVLYVFLVKDACLFLS